MKKRYFILVFTLLFVSRFYAKKISVIGTGYVGLVAGVGLAEIGHKVICADIDRCKIESLKNGKIPIYEQGISDLISKNRQNITFTTDVGRAVELSDILIVAVGTPMGKDGEANLAALDSVIETIGTSMKMVGGYKVIVIKSTVPVGTNKLVKNKLESYVMDQKRFDVVSNPEFLRAGSALKDFFEKNPIVLGSDSEKALSIMEDLYMPLIENGLEMIKTNFETAETIKYAWNSFSAIRIAYVNELSRFCNHCGADIFAVIKGMSQSDKLLPTCKIKPGPGIGGSCLPKDTSAFVKIAKNYGVDLKMVNASIESNAGQVRYVIQRLYDLLDNDVFDKSICILGLSFKPNTDDIRKSPAINVIKRLLQDEACVKAYDPKAMDNMSKLFPQVNYCKTLAEAVKSVHAIVILTDWDEFKALDLDLITSRVGQPVIVDGRNMFNVAELKKRDFSYVNLGRA